MKPSIRWIMPLILSAAVIVIYSRTAGYGFSFLDDRIYIQNNEIVQSGLSLESVAQAFTRPVGHVYIPVVIISYMVDREIFGDWPGGYHLTNLLFHLLNTILLFWVLRKLLGRDGPAAVAALLFAVHPIHVESVAWIAERKDVLSGFFFLATVGVYARWTRRSGIGLYVLGLVLYLLGLMSKAMLVSLPLCLLLLDYWPLGRLSEAGRPGEVSIKPTFKRILEKVPFFLLAGFFSLATLGSTASSAVKMDLAILPLAPRIENALISYVAYLSKLILPVHLGVLYPHPRLEVSHWQAVASGCLLAFLLGAAYHRRRRQPYILMGLLWFLVTLVPVIGLVQAGPQGMADRFVYIPFMGLYMIAGLAVFDYLERKPGTSRIFQTSGAVILAVLTLLSIRQAGFWRDSLTLFQHTAAVTKKNWIMENNIANILSSRGRQDEALRHLSLAWDYAPWEAMTNYNLGIFYQKRKDYPKSVFHLGRTLKADPKYPRARASLGASLAGMGRLEEAARELEAALSTEDSPVDLHLGLGRVYEAMGQTDRARENYQKVLNLDPNNEEAISRLNKMSQGHTDE